MFLTSLIISKKDYKQPEAGPSSIAVIGGSDSTSRRIPSSQDSLPSNLGIPTLGGGTKPASQPFFPGLSNKFWAWCFIRSLKGILYLKFYTLILIDDDNESVIGIRMTIL